MVSKQALIDLTYPFIEESATVILLAALDQRLIDEVLKLSEEYRRSDAEADEMWIGGKLINQSRSQGYNLVDVNIAAKEGSVQNSDRDEASYNKLDSTYGNTGHDEREGPIAHS